MERPILFSFHCVIWLTSFSYSAGAESHIHSDLNIYTAIYKCEFPSAICMCNFLLVTGTRGMLVQTWIGKPVKITSLQPYLATLASNLICIYNTPNKAYLSGWLQNIVWCDPKIACRCFTVEDQRDGSGPDRKLAARRKRRLPGG